jgi:integrase
MGRTTPHTKLDSRHARSRLAPRDKPYYRELRSGKLSVGYRRKPNGSGGTWLARWYLGAGRYRMEPIGAADDRDGDSADGVVLYDYNQACKDAERRHSEWELHDAGMPATPKHGPYTVGDAMDDYLSWLDGQGRPTEDARIRIDAFIRPALGDVPCAKLRAERVWAWRNDLAKARPRLRTKQGKAQKYRTVDGDKHEARRRRHASVNRTLTVLKAALNRAWGELHKIASDAGWRRVKAYDNAGGVRMRYLSIAEAVRLLNASTPEFRDLARAALLTGARYGELAALDCHDYNPDSGTVHVTRSKSGKPRHVVLTDEGQAFFKSLAAGRAGTAPLLRKADGARWSKWEQNRAMRDANQHAKIDPPITFHGLRHTYASLTIMAGAPLLVVAKNLGHRDTRMVEEHYGHLAPSFIADAIRAAAPRFGITPDSKVEPLK